MKYSYIFLLFVTFGVYAKDPNVLARKVQIENLEAQFYEAKAKKAEALQRLRLANGSNQNVKGSGIKLVGVEFYGKTKSAYLKVDNAINEYNLGDIVGNGFKIVSINKNAVILKSKGVFINLSFSSSVNK